MASEGQLLDHLDEQFCQCSICLKPFTKPKLLPCLHRFCRDCLIPLFENLGPGDTFKCPMCREEVAVTENGVDDMRNDFLVSELTQVIQLQKGISGQSQVRKCESCTKELESAGFCSNCGGFLCQECLDFHHKLKVGLLKDHQPVIDLKDVISGKVKIGMEKLSQFTKAPRCQNHPENILRLSCVTCGGQQICIACTYEDHVEHRAESIKNIAGKHREDLRETLDDLKASVVNWENNSTKLREIRDKITTFVGNMTGHIEKETARKLEILQEESRDANTCLEERVTELKDKNASRRATLEKERDEKIKDIEEYYQREIEKYATETENDIEEEREQYRGELHCIESQRSKLSNHRDEMVHLLSKWQLHQLHSIEKMVPVLSNTQKRFDNIITTASSVLAVANDWSAIDTIPNLSSAFIAIKDNVMKTKTKMEHLESNISEVPQLSFTLDLEDAGRFERKSSLEYSVNVSHLSLESVESVTWMRSLEWLGISGGTKVKGFSTVIMVDLNGRSKFHKSFGYRANATPWRFIGDWDENSVATVCHNTIGTLDLTESTYNNIQISGPPLIYVCVDHHEKQLLTYQYKDSIVKVYDANLQFVKERKLPGKPNRVCMATYGDKLIVGCNREKKDAKVFVLDKEDLVLDTVVCHACEKVREDEYWWCKDLSCSTKGFLCVLWLLQKGNKQFVEIYGPSLSPVEVIQDELPSNAKSITLVEVDSSIKLVVASNGKFSIFKTW
ncbi:E3 ubiquitin-protein ligase TRIM56 [Holothuria leucospilota]|uniref:E3 ubiquitin-protein ligase TRIM56 n=1 Tax=Holothuria leucospilota TaxID=206669 RepID=A0A9Q1BH99_HOLLE|nr:E3 ubiquitin-protein ligase TRIM56 [Holothuria leucospilota]